MAIAISAVFASTQAIALDSELGYDIHSDVTSESEATHSEVKVEKEPVTKAPVVSETVVASRTTGNPTTVAANPQTGSKVQDPGTLGISLGGAAFDVFGLLNLIIRGGTFLPTIGGSYFLTETTALRVAVGLGLELEPNTDFGLSLGASYRNYHRGLPRRVAPFFEPGGSFAWFDDTLLLQGFFLYGAEYFFNDQISISGAMGFEMNMRDGTDAIWLISARSLLDLTIYW